MAVKMRYGAVSFKERLETADIGKPDLPDNCLAVVNPELAAEWHPTKNGELTPEMVTAGSGRKVWWKGKCGHVWKATIPNRHKGRGCPYCSGRRTLIGINDLATIHPDLASEWHPTKNGDLKPEMVKVKSNKKVWWKGKCGHEWQAIIANRSKGRNCPYCSNTKTLIGFNDLYTTNPELAAEWHPTRNKDLSPYMVTNGCDKKVWWLGKCGHEWQARIYTRSSGCGCPVCEKEYKTSFAEQAIYYYVKKNFPDATNRDIAMGKELDILIPSLNTAIEYDGEIFHTNVNKDKQKNEWCKSRGIKLIRVREINCPSLDEENVVIRNGQSEQSLNTSIVQVMNLLGVTKHSVDIKRDSAKIYNQYILNRRQNSLAVKFPQIASEWHPTKNGILTPEMFSPCSNKTVWWKCKYGHEWPALINNRARLGSGCPYCSRLNVLIGQNDLKTTNPDIAEEWHPTKNGDLSPDQVLPGSGKTVWWKCKQGHEYKAVIYDRKNGGCPYCSGRKVLKGYNDLKTVNPELALEWHPTKNGTLTPDTVTKGSYKKVWWKCKQGHEWQMKVADRSKGNGCPYCSGKRVLKGFNDLATVNPELAAEWHPTKNGELTPEMVTKKSGKKVWWQCKQGHEWQAIIDNRSKGSGCPYCAGQKVLKGFNDLATVNPRLAAEWHPTKNGELTPEMVTKKSGKKVWWQCRQGHEWQATIANRSKGSGCPICRKSKNKQ